MRIAARPALKRKNFTPASRDTSASVKMMPMAKWGRKRKRTTNQAGRAGRAGGVGHPARLAQHVLSSQTFVNFRPVHDVPPRADVVGTPILVLQIVRVLPHVQSKHDLLAFHQRAVLV